MMSNCELGVLGGNGRRAAAASGLAALLGTRGIHVDGGGELDAVPGGCRQYYVEGKGCIYYLVDHGSPNVAERECAARSLARSMGFLRLHPIW